MLLLFFASQLKLFDNLFLDANTPVTINDGVDHSKDVVQNIRLAFFDPEFSKNYEVSFIESFNQKFNQQIILNKNKTLNHVFKFLTQK